MTLSKDIPSPDQSNDTVKVIDVVRNPKGVTRFEGHYTFEDLKTEGNVSCQWQLQPETAGLSVHGKLQALLKLECGRCLETFQLPLSLNIEERYVFNSFFDPAEKEKELHAEDFFEVVEEEGQLDLKDLVHQFLLLECENSYLCGQPECRLA